MSKTEALERQFLTLWDTVLNLALPASEQIAILQALGDSSAVDELALDYDDNFRVFDKTEVQNQLTRDELSALRALDRQLDEMSGEEHAENWTVEALRFSDCWQEVRTLARIALAKRQIAKIRKSEIVPSGSP